MILENSKMNLLILIFANVIYNNTHTIEWKHTVQNGTDYNVLVKFIYVACPEKTIKIVSKNSGESILSGLKIGCILKEIVAKRDNDNKWITIFTADLK